MLGSLKLQFGSSRSSDALAFQLTPITIIVGPNNAGKSLAIREIGAYCTSGHVSDARIVESVLPKVGEAERELMRAAVQDDRGQTLKVGTKHAATDVARADWEACLGDPSSRPTVFFGAYLSGRIVSLDAARRTSLVKPHKAVGLRQNALDPLNVLLRDDELRQDIRSICFEAFGSHLVLDPTDVKELKLRFSERKPSSRAEECSSFDSACVAFHDRAEPIDAFSDGVKAFVGILLASRSFDSRVVLIDEPEAFLHPSLAQRIGVELTKAAMEQHFFVFAATHSAAFLLGCIQAGAPVNMVRLTYETGFATATLLHSNDIRELQRDPMLRSTGALESLFYEAVVVTEGDADRAFYEEINQRLVMHSTGGIAHCKFLNAQNKQTIHRIVRPLRAMGVPCACVVDIDFLTSKDSWKPLLAACGVPSATIEGLGQARGRLAAHARGKDLKSCGAVQGLAGESGRAALDLIASLARYGLFVVPVGELEAWLGNEVEAVSKSRWISAAFDRLGADPLDADYLRPGPSDVWDFVRTIGRWTSDSARHGMLLT